MKEFLNRAIRKYYLNLGKYKFSPVIQLSTSISLDYAEAIENTNSSSPLVLTFPSKQNASLWLSCQFLVKP